MISAKLCHYTTKFNSERHKSTKIFSIHSSKILFFPYSLYYWAFQDPPYRHRRCKVNTPSSSMQAHFVKARIHFAVYPRTYPYRRCKGNANWEQNLPSSLGQLCRGAAYLIQNYNQSSKPPNMVCRCLTLVCRCRIFHLETPNIC